MSDGAEIPALVGEAMGMGPLSWSEQEGLVLEFESGDRLCLEREQRDQTLLLYLARSIPVGEDVEAILLRALELCHYGHGRVFPVHAGLVSGDRLLFLIRMPLADATLPALQSAIDLLLGLEDKAFSG
jgi:type III secretion system chaperone SycN